MAYWLFKSEPSCWSWQDHLKAGIAEWDGVRNFQARGYLRAMALGDKGFFYHSVTEKSIVGIVEVVKTYYPDPTDERGMFGMVDVRALQASAPSSHPSRHQSRRQIGAHPFVASIALVGDAHRRTSVADYHKTRWHDRSLKLTIKAL